MPQPLTEPTDSIRELPTIPQGFTAVPSDLERRMGLPIATLSRRSPGTFVRVGGEVFWNPAVAAATSCRVI